MIHSNNSDLRHLRRALRKNATPAEATLWKYLKNKTIIGQGFRRQFGIDKYILDFYCPKGRLAIELDGNDHFGTEEYEKDEIRTKYLLSRNIKVLRFENELIFQNIETVLDMIKQELRDRIEYPSSPSVYRGSEVTPKSWT